MKLCRMCGKKAESGTSLENLDFDKFQTWSVNYLGAKVILNSKSPGIICSLCMNCIQEWHTFSKKAKKLDGQETEVEAWWLNLEKIKMPKQSKQTTLLGGKSKWALKINLGK